MKQGTLITKIIMFIILAAVVIYLGIYAIQGLADPFSSVMAYQDSLDDAVEVTGMLVREEQVLASGSAIMDLLPDEGERVAAGDTVAILYQSSEALERKKALQSLEQERDHLQAALNSGGDLGDAAELERQILQTLQSLHANIAEGELSSLENDTLSLRTLMLQREFTYSASEDSAAALVQTLSALNTQIEELNAQSSSETSSVYAPRSGLFSGLTDGLEAVLTPDSLESMTVGDLQNLIHGNSSSEGVSVGKLITGDRWYFAAVVDPSTAARLSVGSTVTVAFSRDFTGEVDMRVDRIGTQEADGCVLVLSSDRHLKDVTLLRTQTVSLIFRRYTGVRVPKESLHLEPVFTVHPETGEKTSTQVLGVYAVAGAQAEFRPVDIVREGTDYYLVAPSSIARNYIIQVKDGEYHRVVPSEGQSLPLLRAGDQVIVTASDLYIGKVVLK